jgi:hypothetical protein
MMVIQMSSALTRNLTMQLMPIGTWILSLIFYYYTGNADLGESLNQYSYVRFIGFVLVLIGSYLYMRRGSSSTSAGSKKKKGKKSNKIKDAKSKDESEKESEGESEDKKENDSKPISNIFFIS